MDENVNLNLTRDEAAELLDLINTHGSEALRGVANELAEILDTQADAEPFDDSMDGDHATALRDAGWGTDEDYGYYGGDED